MKEIYFGKNNRNENIYLDLEKLGTNFILLAGATNSGKSIFHFNLYKELSEKYSPEKLGFVFLDMTKNDFFNWKSDYLIKPVVTDPEQAIKTLLEVAELKTDKIIFIHIEECDMVFHDRDEMERAFDKLKIMKNGFLVYSTSRMDRFYLGNWMEKYIDMKIIFSVATEDDSVFLLGNSLASSLNYRGRKRGERIIVFNNKFTFFEPFTDEEAEKLNNFKLQ
jgi:hypothetical protein